RSRRFPLVASRLCPPGPPTVDVLLASPRPRPLRPPLFPYTTLFRSGSPARTCSRSCATTRRRQPGFSPNAHSGNTTVPRSQPARSEEHTSELQSRENIVCRLLLEKKK